MFKSPFSTNLTDPISVTLQISLLSISYFTKYLFKCVKNLLKDEIFQLSRDSSIENLQNGNLNTFVSIATLHLSLSAALAFMSISQAASIKALFWSAISCWEEFQIFLIKLMNLEALYLSISIILSWTRFFFCNKPKVFLLLEFATSFP